METVGCYICKSSDQKHFIKNNGFNIVKCFNCSHIYLSPRPDAYEVEKYYSSSYMPHSSEKTLFSRLYRLVQSYAFKWKFGIVSSFSTGKNVLDFGGGKGDFVKFLNKHGYNSSLYDKNVEQSAVLKDQEVKVISSLKDIKTNHFDLITMWHSLEHIHDLDKLFFLINSCLKRSGRVIVSVPNIKAPEMIFFKEFWVALDSPRHLNHFSSESLGKIFKDKGYIVENKKRMLHDTAFNILMSIKEKPVFIAFFPFILLYSLITVIIGGPDRSSSLMFVFKKK
ncbi:MAG: hypothetical protein CBD58_00150 [bacterium TMED198]|nr:MAG: hypothetical protein CBD58_00150 [bacterium TMED198]|tara:strand:+ start:1281 stop:2123 length:843 start_codon:yes stop_codon:yes gene_type:complete